MAFCCISTGKFHFPNKRAAEIEVEVVKEFINNYGDKFARIIFNVFKDLDREIYKELFKK